MPSKNTVGGLKNGDTMLVLAFCASVPSARFFESLTFCLFVCCLQVQVRVSCGGKLSEMDEANAARFVFFFILDIILRSYRKRKGIHCTNSHTFSPDLWSLLRLLSRLLSRL